MTKSLKPLANASLRADHNLTWITVLPSQAANQLLDGLTQLLLPT